MFSNSGKLTKWIWSSIPYFIQLISITCPQKHMLRKIVRPPSRMAVSRSYPRHLVQFREKKRKKESILPPLSRFCSFHLLCCISSNVPRVPKGSQRCPKVPEDYPWFPKVPQGSGRFPKFPKISQLFSFVLLALTDHYIKSSDGGLWCEWNLDFF